MPTRAVKPAYFEVAQSAGASTVAFTTIATARKVVKESAAERCPRTKRRTQQGDTERLRVRSVRGFMAPAPLETGEPKPGALGAG